MKIVSYFASENQKALQEKILAADWGAAKFLVELLQKGTFFDMVGGEGEIYLLMDGENLVSFATLTRQDAIRDESMYPWVGFVYTFEAYRGHRYSGQLLAYIEGIAAQRGHKQLYVCTDHVGLYEKHGYEYLENRLDFWGDDSRILVKNLQT